MILLAVVVALAACAPKPEELMQRAAASLDKGDARSAIIDLKAVLQKQPQNADARAMLGGALAATGDSVGAEIELKKATDLGVDSSKVLVASCRVMLAKEEFDKVVAGCSPETGTPKQKFELQLISGSALLRSQRAPEAKEMFAAARAARPNDLNALLGAAAAAQAADGLPAAKQVMDEAPAKIKEAAPYWLALAGVYAQMEDLAAAEAAYVTAGEKAQGGPDSPQRMMALGGLAEVQIRQGKVAEANTTTAKLIKVAPNHPMVKQLRAQAALADGKLDEARTLLEDVVSHQPDNWNARLLLGMVNAKQGNLDQALMHLQEVVANSPGNVTAQRLLAAIRTKLGAPDEALAGVKRSLEETPDDPVMLAMAGRLSLASGNKAQAMNYLAAASKAGPQSDPKTQLDVANGYLVAGEVDRAIEVLESMPEGGAAGRQRDAMLLLTLLRKGDQAQLMAETKTVLDRSPKDPETRKLVGGIYAGVGKTDMAREQFNEASRLAPNDPVPYVSLGKLDIVAGKIDSAEANFQRALAKDPKNLTATLGMAVTATARKDTKSTEKYFLKAREDHPEAPEANIGLAQFYVLSGQPAKAREVVDAASKANPSNAAIAHGRGQILLALKDLPGATASFEEAVRLDPKSSTNAIMLARTKLASRDVPGALGVVDNFLKTSPKSVSVLALGAATAMQNGQFEKATGYLERVKQLAPEAAATYLLEGDLAMVQKRYKEASANYRKASAAGASSGQLAVAQYRAATLAGEPDPAKPLEDWVAKNPGDVGAVTELAEHVRSQGNSRRSIDLYEAALAKSPDSVILLNNLASLYDANKDPKAIDYAARAYKAAPKSPAIADTYGWILFKQGKTEQALPLLRDAVKGLPDNAEVQYHMGAALAKSGNKAEAKSHIDKALTGKLPADAKVDAQALQKQLAK